jgi:hypothetical protein
MPLLNGQQDFYSIFLHEVFHGFGLWSTAQHGQPPTSFDKLTMQANGEWFFIGASTTQYYGKSLPLAKTGSRDHFSNKIPVEHNLNREYGYYRTRWDITGLELAVLKDLGLELTPEGNELLTKEFTTPEEVDPVTGEKTHRLQSGDALMIRVFDQASDKLEIPDDIVVNLQSKTFYSIEYPIHPSKNACKKELTAFKKSRQKAKTLERKSDRIGDAFLHVQRTGEFYVDTNGTQKGFGDGGLLAILTMEKQPTIGIGNILL